MGGSFSRFDTDGGTGTRILRRRIAAAATLMLSLSVVPSCHKPGDPARETLDDLTRSAHDRDAKSFLDLVGADFQAADGSRKSDLESTLRQFFAAYETLDVTVRDLTVERSEGAALARFRADLSGRARKISGLEGLLPSSSSWQFETRLAPSDGRWRVTWASWSQTR